MRARLGIVLSMLFVSGTLGAEPNVWDAARDPKAKRAEHALVAVERMLLRADAALDPTMQRNFLRGGLAMLEVAGGEELADPRLRFLLGDLLISVGRDEKGREILARALDSAPDSPLSGRAWFNLAIASAKLGDPTREKEAYTRALEVVWDPSFRANIYINRGESSMVQGDLGLAVRDYRRAIALADRPDHQALAYYGLGIALERSGDLPAALAAMRIAESIQLPGWGSALDLPGVFFVPAYDKHYYRALGAMALAREATEPKAERAELERAAVEWQSYLEGAQADGHRWLRNAELHLAGVKKALEKNKAKKPSPKR